jgi:hypothetical protein
MGNSANQRQKNKQCFGNVPSPCDLWNETKAKQREINSAEECKTALEKLVAKFQISEFKYEPRRAARILNDDLHFRFWQKEPTPQTVVQQYVENKPAAFTDLATLIVNCVSLRHPAVCEILAKVPQIERVPAFVVWKDGITDKPKNKTWDVQEFLKEMWHCMLIFDALVIHAVANVHFQHELIRYYNRQKMRYFKSLPEYVQKTNFFSLVKGESVQWEFPIWDKMRVIHQDQKMLLAEKQKRLHSLSEKSRFGLTLNIFEAVVADQYHFHLSDNAKAGMALVMHPIEKVEIVDNPDYAKGSEESKQNAIVQFEMSPIWDAMYFSWNLCFLSKISHPHLTFAKLFHPYVSCAEGKDFIYRRAISLNMTVQSFMLDQLTKSDYPGPIETKWFTNELAKINRDYAQWFLSYTEGVNLDSYMHRLQRLITQFPHLSSNLLTMLYENPLSITQSRKDFTGTSTEKIKDEEQRERKNKIIKALGAMSAAQLYALYRMHTPKTAIEQRTVTPS